MYISITGAKENRDVYILQSYRKENGTTSSRIYKKLGKYNELLSQFEGDEAKLMVWAKSEAEKETKRYEDLTRAITVSFAPLRRIPIDEKRSFNVSYLFLQKICTELRLERICKSVKASGRFEFDLYKILCDLVYARILSPASKRSSYSYCHSLLEPPTYALQDVYRALSVLAAASDQIQMELYHHSKAICPRNGKILFYDCTNYYFEIEQQDEFRRYGKSKEHRPNPIVTMGLFMDADGIPLAFDIFPGNQNEQTTLRPLEKKIIEDFGCASFIFCSDAGLGSLSNRRFNGFGNRAYVITHSLKKMKEDDRSLAMDPKQFRALGSLRFIDISVLNEEDEAVYQTIYYKELPLDTKDLSEVLLVTYSPKYKAYQRHIRDGQVARARKIIESGERYKRTKNQNDPARFIKKTAVTDDGEVANKTISEIDDELINEESRYDGFYAVVTNLDGDVGELLKITQRRWEIEECFQIMKSEFEARPVYVRREDRIKAHFLTCFLSLLVYRLLEKKLKCQYTCTKILETLRGMQLVRLSKEGAYVPAYTRTAITDSLHEAFGLRSDFEILTRAAIKKLIRESKILTQPENKKNQPQNSTN